MARRVILYESELLAIVQVAVKNFTDQKAAELESMAAGTPAAIQVSLAEALRRFAADMRRARVASVDLELPEEKIIDDEAPTHPGRVLQ